MERVHQTVAIQQMDLGNENLLEGILSSTMFDILSTVFTTT